MIEDIDQSHVIKVSAEIQSAITIGALGKTHIYSRTKDGVNSAYIQLSQYPTIHLGTDYSYGDPDSDFEAQINTLLTF